MLFIVVKFVKGSIQIFFFSCESSRNPISPIFRILPNPETESPNVFLSNWPQKNLFPPSLDRPDYIWF
ncbi:hypothetical protein L596_007084 [Steinernema carpocapsae]|uniref:Uncharacterized protein n=1 Tax=Steinernema carpocapsae TaxID=34508 RepID=A0A4U5P8W5_STECR|nr:hypothetical protein L596_007084 [Steinernema carpocapsae]